MTTPDFHAAFKAYDVRGRMPDQINPDVARALGFAFARYLGAQRIVLGQDARPDSPALADAVAEGIQAAGCAVLDLGLCGTEEVYFATGDSGACGGLMVTASHNPIDYNGFKLVREGSKPIGQDTGLTDIRDAVGTLLSNGLPEGGARGARQDYSDKSRYVEKLLSFVDPAKLKPLKIVSNAGNGTAGLPLDLLEPHLPFTFTKLDHAPDPTFPNGIPNPLLTENRARTAQAVIDSGADMGIAWDGDFDRCFFFDGAGNFIEGYYIVGLLADALLKQTPGAGIVYDVRMTWNTIDIVEQAGGRAIQSRSGHSFIKQLMREEDALYGGEMSAHHYFRDFFFCDSGQIPWLLVAALLSADDRTLAQMVDDRIAAFPCSGEINFRVDDAQAVLARVQAFAEEGGAAPDLTDGLSADLATWRFNVRSSNTEPLLRLNVEAKGDIALMQAKTAELSALIEG